MSTLNVSNISDGTTSVGTGYVVNGSAKAWVNFNGTGTIAARDSLNVSSLTDDGTGLYGSNLINALANVNASGSSSANNGVDTYNRACATFVNTVSLVEHYAFNTAGTDAIDCSFVLSSIHGDLA